MFAFNEPYDPEGKAPQEILSDFQEMLSLNEDANHPGFEGRVLDALACWLPRSTLAEFMDDLAMGRV